MSLAHNDFIAVRGSDRTTLDDVSGAVAASGSDSESKSKSTNPAVIAVAVVGGVIGLCAIAVAAFLFYSRKRKSRLTSMGSASNYRSIDSDDEEPFITSTREVPGKVELYDPYAGKLGQ